MFDLQVKWYDASVVEADSRPAMNSLNGDLRGWECFLGSVKGYLYKNKKNTPQTTS